MSKTVNASVYDGSSLNVVYTSDAMCQFKIGRQTTFGNLSNDVRKYFSIPYDIRFVLVDNLGKIMVLKFFFVFSFFSLSRKLTFYFFSFLFHLLYLYIKPPKSLTKNLSSKKKYHTIFIILYVFSLFLSKT